MLTKKTFFCFTEINIIFSDIHRIKTKPKNNYQNFQLTQNTLLTHPGILPLKEIPFSEFKLTHTKDKRANH